MPLQIKEMYIKVSVNADQDAENPASETPNVDSGADNSTATNNNDIIAQCVEQVIEILKEKSES